MNIDPDDKLKPSQELDDNELAAEANELDFDEDDYPAHRAGDVGSDETMDRSPEAARQAGLTEASTPGHTPTADDATPGVMQPEDGARSAHDTGSAEAADTDVSIVGADEIGGGTGLDEAEQARRHPLDGKSWDGDEADSDAD